MKILLIAGHGAGDPGACSSYGTESNETRRVIEGLKAYFKGYKVDVDVYPTNRNAYNDIGNGCLQVNFANYDYVLEIHFNSAGNVSASGVEIFVMPNENGITVEQAIVKKVSDLGYPNRGVKRDDFRVIRTAKNSGTSSALLEVCFISNQGDMSLYNRKYDEVCKAITSGIAEEFGIGTNGTTVTPPTQNNKPSVASSVNYRVKTKEGKQLGAYNSLDNAKNMAQSNKAIVYDLNNNVVVSYVTTSNGARYLNLHSHMKTWAVYNQNGPYTKQYAVVNLAPQQYGGLSYEIKGEKGGDVYLIDTESFGRVAIWAPIDNDSSITNSPIY